MTKNNAAISFLWLLSHEESYCMRSSYHAMLLDGRLLSLNQNRKIIEEVLPPANWLVPDLPLIEIAELEATVEKHGIIVDFSIAQKLRSITESVLGNNYDPNGFNSADN